MDRLLYEIAMRTQNKAKTLEFEARNLSDTVDNLRDENRLLKRLRRSQDREIHERHDFVDMANLSLKSFRRDVRFSEENCVGAQANTRRVNASIIHSFIDSWTDFFFSSFIRLFTNWLLVDCLVLFGRGLYGNLPYLFYFLSFNVKL